MNFLIFTKYENSPLKSSLLHRKDGCRKRKCAYLSGEGGNNDRGNKTGNKCGIDAAKKYT